MAEISKLSGITHVLPLYTALAERAEELRNLHGDRVGTAACIQLRVLAILWAKANSAFNSARFENDSRWENQRLRFFPIVSQAQPHRQPDGREIAASAKLLLQKLPADDFHHVLAA